MTAAASPGGVRNPLQLFGLYLGWAETALSASLFATQGSEHWTKHFLMAMMGVGLIVYVGVTAFILIYLVIYKPGFLFNPSDYDRAVQPMLFGAPAPAIEDPDVVAVAPPQPPT